MYDVRAYITRPRGAGGAYELPLLAAASTSHVHDPLLLFLGRVGARVSRVVEQLLRVLAVLRVRLQRPDRELEVPLRHRLQGLGAGVVERHHELRALNRAGRREAVAAVAGVGAFAACGQNGAGLHQAIKAALVFLLRVHRRQQLKLRDRWQEEDVCEPRHIYVYPLGRRNLFLVLALCRGTAS